MILKCEICGLRISKEVFNSSQTLEGKGKNKGECDNCANELRETMKNILDNMRINNMTKFNIEIDANNEFFDYNNFIGLGFEGRLLYHCLLEEWETGIEDLEEIAVEITKVSPEDYGNCYIKGEAHVFTYVRSLLGLTDNTEKWEQILKELKDQHLLFYYEGTPVILDMVFAKGYTPRELYKIAQVELYRSKRVHI